MKNTILALAALLLAAPIHAEGPFREASFEEALAAAKKDGKVVFVDFFTTWCAPCKKLDATTWKDAAVVSWLGEKTIALKLDAEVETKLAARYRIQVYPTMIFIDPDGTERGRIVGYRDATGFLSEAKDRVAGRTELDRIEEELLGDPKNVELRRDRANELARAQRHEEALEEYLWCFEAGRTWPGYGGVRLSYLLGEIVRLGAEHPPAVAALVELGEAATKRLREGKGDGLDAARELSSINSKLDRSSQTLALYDELRAVEETQPAVLGVLFDEVFDVLLEKKRYADVLEAAGDVFHRFQSKVDLYESMVRTYADEDPELSPVEYMKRFAVTEGAKLYEALLGVRDAETAAELAERILELDASTGTFRELVARAAAVENYETARRLLERGFATLPEDQHKRLGRAERRLPREERLDRHDRDA